MPTVEIMNTDDQSQSQMEQCDIVLEPLKQEKPVPFGINIVQESSGEDESIESPDIRRSKT